GRGGGARGGGRGEHQQAADDRERDEGIMEAGPERVYGERVREPGVGERDPQGPALGTRPDPSPEADQRERREQLVSERGRAGGRDLVPAAAPREGRLEGNVCEVVDRPVDVAANQHAR